jgi:hypothetical protein
MTENDVTRKRCGGKYLRDGKHGWTCCHSRDPGSARSVVPSSPGPPSGIPVGDAQGRHIRPRRRTATNTSGGAGAGTSATLVQVGPGHTGDGGHRATITGTPAARYRGRDTQLWCRSLAGAVGTSQRGYASAAPSRMGRRWPRDPACSTARRAVVSPHAKKGLQAGHGGA